MIKVSAKVRGGAASFRVAVRAASVERAVNLVGERHPGTVARTRLPAALDAGAETSGPRQPSTVAA